jgi:hypothetical protein
MKREAPTMQPNSQYSADHPTPLPPHSVGASDSGVWKNYLNLNSTTTTSEPWGDPTTTPELLHDTGFLGILDTLIVMQAEWFVSGSRRDSQQRYVPFHAKLVAAARSQDRLLKPDSGWAG